MKMYKKKMLAWLLGLCCFFGTFFCGTVTLLAMTLEEAEAKMDAPLEMEAALYGDLRTLYDQKEPDVQIGKSAHWLDIERGYAQIDLTETDTSGYSNQAMDYIIILDRTRTMALNDTVFEGNSSNTVVTSNSPCLNRDHYYEYNGQKLDLYDYEHGIVRGTNQVITLPLEINLYNYHRDASGHAISVGYDNGCVDRLSIAKDTICGLVDRIADNSPDDMDAKSRVSYWSFAGTYWPEAEGDLDTDREKGLFNYVGLTSTYSGIKENVQATKAYAGTYYLESLKRAYEQLTARSGSYKDMPSKVIFISDGKCADNEKEVMEWANKLKKIPNCTVYTLAVGMPVSSEGAVLLKNMSSRQNNTTFAAFTTNLNSSNPAFAETLTSIEAVKTEVKATQKVMTDVLDLRYWEFVEVLSADGTAAVTDGVLIWNIPEGAQNTYTCSLKLRLKEEYRFLLSDTQYPTNYDTPETKGCRLGYVISGGVFHGEDRLVEKETPYLKYGTVRVEGTKYFVVDGSEADCVTMYLKRKLDNGYIQDISEEERTSSDGWGFVFKDRSDKGEILPLVLYTNKQEKWIYFMEEKAEGYVLTEQTQESKDNALLFGFYNEPMKCKVKMQKTDAQTEELLSGAVFGVYAYSKRSDAYVPYCGTQSSVSGTDMVKLAESEQGIYESVNWLYYTPDNEGRFRIIEEKSPIGYIGDYPNGDVTCEKNFYEICITMENNGTWITETVEEKPLKAENYRVKGKIKVHKTDADSGLPVPQGAGALFYEDESLNAKYGLFTKENELVVEKRINGEGFLEFEDLELGTYYIKELDTPPEGYLLNTEINTVTLKYQNENVPLVIEHVYVKEPVKKQSQIIYKISGNAEDEEYSWITDAGFMVFPFSSFGDVVLGMDDEEILAYVDANYRNSKTRTYELLKELPSVTLYKDGKEYMAEEIHSEDGIYETPRLPYGDYVIAETTVPEGKRAVRPFVLHVRADDSDGTTLGDGNGTSLKAKVLRDEDILCKIRILKMDADTKAAVRKGTAGYVIHDIEGAFKERFLKSASIWERAEYLLKYDGLVVEYDKSAKCWRGSYKNPYIAESMIMNGEMILTAATREGLPVGQYELEEVSAPEGYILQGMEGQIAIRDEDTEEKGLLAANRTYYETKENGNWKKTPSQPVRFSVGMEEGSYDAEDDCWWVFVYQENCPAIGKISLKAEKEEYETDSDGNKTGKTKWVPMTDEKFLLYAREDIFAGDGSLIYKKNTQINSFITNKEGTAWTGITNNESGEPEGLYPGVYRLVWLQDDMDSNRQIREERIIHLEYQDEKTPVIYADEVFRIPLEKQEDINHHVIEEGVIPKTGDSNPLILLAASVLLSVGLTVAVLYKKKRGRND